MSTQDKTVRDGSARQSIDDRGKSRFKARALRFARYTLMGLMGTTVQYALLVALTATHAASAVIASTVGAAAGAVVNYVLNYRITFRSNAKHTHAAPRFFVVAAAGMAVNAWVMHALVERLHVYYLLAQCVATGVVLLSGFVVNSVWSFRARYSG
ncbi:GtrA family protein [Paraburkholderia kururiensis]|uniref:GtrA family protein n=1 Tax=Paraburkholderia kururiensis TaxID=984307 RepID=A0ABZ0WL06_9BURK|nr:GtrA family protein [Paraburkholderia kururiensis]WQD77971.1 GtrA family protein [Paraburkholderia kururiensis]